MFRVIALMLTMAAVTACTNPDDLDQAPVDLGAFQLGHNVVLAPNLTKGLASRDASKEELIASLQTAIEDRFGRYEGDQLYHLGISIEGYVLAIPGIPIIASPKSALILNVTVWDDAAQKKLNDKPHLVTALETLGPRTVLGSGLTQSRERQMENLSLNAAKLIQNWIKQENYENGWFAAVEQPDVDAEDADQAADTGVISDDTASDTPEVAPLATEVN